MHLWLGDIAATDLPGPYHPGRADRRDATGQISLFTEDAHFVVYIDAKDPTPSQDLHTREALAPV
jgi:hypothetical protein